MHTLSYEGRVRFSFDLAIDWERLNESFIENGIPLRALINQTRATIYSADTDTIEVEDFYFYFVAKPLRYGPHKLVELEREDFAFVVALLLLLKHSHKKLQIESSEITYNKKKERIEVGKSWWAGFAYIKNKPYFHMFHV